MKELTRTRRLSIITLIFVFILVVGFLTFSKPAFVYLLTPEETLEELSKVENLISQEALSKILAKSDPSYALVDLRNPYDYIKGFLGEAINIPVSEILTKESISFFDEMKNNSVEVILYGNDPLEANGPWMLLKQLGYNNVKVLLGGYDYFSDKRVKINTSSENTDYQAEKPIVDFAKVLKDNTVMPDNVSDEKKTNKQIIPVKRKKKAVTSGGC